MRTFQIFDIWLSSKCEKFKFSHENLRQSCFWFQFLWKNCNFSHLELNQMPRTWNILPFLKISHCYGRVYARWVSETSVSFCFFLIEIIDWTNFVSTFLGAFFFIIFLFFMFHLFFLSRWNYWNNFILGWLYWAH